MQMHRWATWQAAMVIGAALALAAPAVLAQSAPPGIAVDKMVTIVAGNTVVTERTFLNDQLVKVETTVTSPSGQLLRKEETTFDPATGQPIRMELKVFQANGQVIVKKFELRNGVLTLVQEEPREAEQGPEHGPEPEHGPGHH